MGSGAAAVRDPGRVPVLDGIRGLAILLVLLCHFTLFGGVAPRTTADWVYFKLTLPLGCGVDLFFVLSGFLISGILLDTREGPRYFRSFYMRRVLRIFPLYYGFLLFLYQVLPHLMPPGEAFQRLMAQQGWDWAYLSNFRVALHGWPQPQYVGHFWSLAIEEQFYLVWPTVVLLLRRRRLMAMCGALIALGIAVRFAHWGGEMYWVRGYMTWARLDGLAAGAWLAAFARGPGGLERLRPAARVAGALSLVAVVHLVTSEGRFAHDARLAYLFLETLYAVLFGSLLTLTVTSPRGSLLERVFSSRALVFLGIYSYGLYVYHEPILVYAVEHGVGAYLVSPVLGSVLPGILAVAVVLGGAGVVTAVLSYHLYEQRFLRLKRFFEPGRRARVVPATEALG